MLLLSESDVRQLLSMDDLIQTMESALAEFSSGRVQQPLRTVLEVGPSHAFFGVMPAFMPASGALGTKLVTVFGSNAAVGLPTHLATILLMDSDTGELLSVMDGRYITEARTAAVSAVSARLLARGDAGVLAILGSGVQARSHLRAFSHVRGLRDVRVWSPSAIHRREFAEQMHREIAGADFSPSQRSGKRWTAPTSSWWPRRRGNRFCKAHGSPTARISRPSGACRPDHREMDTELVKRARVFVDSRTGALAEAGDLVSADPRGCD